MIGPNKRATFGYTPVAGGPWVNRKLRFPRPSTRETRQSSAEYSGPASLHVMQLAGGDPSALSWPPPTFCRAPRGPHADAPVDIIADSGKVDAVGPPLLLHCTSGRE